jgi:hypothetical protein
MPSASAEMLLLCLMLDGARESPDFSARSAVLGRTSAVEALRLVHKQAGLSLTTARCPKA